MLSIEHLQKSYGKKEVLRGISASFGGGLIHGIMGLNGAGKTTLFNCICGLLDHSGRIYADMPGLLKNIIGYVPTEPYFFPRTTGREYLEFIKHAKGVKDLSGELLHYFELPLGEYIENYSTGMKKKLAFLGAMVGDSEIYIFDEPFNGVDIKSNLLIKQQILKLRTQNKTILLSSHIISSLTELCDEMRLLKDGRLVKHYLPEAYHSVEADMLEL